MDSSQTLYARFAWGCWRHSREILDLLDHHDPALPQTSELIDAIIPKVRDFLGDTKMIGLEKLAGLASGLLAVLELRRSSATPEELAELRGWIERLYALGTQLTTTAPVSASFAEMQKLGEELVAAARPSSGPAGVAVHTGDCQRVLVFDDSPVVREAIAAELEQHGYSVAIAGTVDSFISWLDEFEPQLILLDVNMPEVRGDEICGDLKQRLGRAVPIILLSSLPETELAARAARCGADGYLSKERGLAALLEYLQSMARRGDGTPTVFQHFARRCEQRKDEVRRLLTRPGGDRDREALMRELKQCINDFIGESKLLGLDKLASAGEALAEIASHWGTTGDGLRVVLAWIDRLCKLGGEFIYSTPDSETARELQRLRGEIDEELRKLGAEQTQVASSELLQCGPRRILIFDDSPVIQEALAFELKEQGYVVALAGNLAEFGRHLEEFRPQAILLDMNMPEMRGDRVCEQLRAQFGERVSIILMSSLAEAELEALARRAGADGHLSKQKGIDEIVQRVNTLLYRPMLLF